MSALAPAAWRSRLARSFRWHGAAFIAVNLVLTAANAAAGPPWWALWPLIATTLLLALHYFLRKAFTVDERWAEERATELNLKSYDRSHIEDIKSRRIDARPDHDPKRS